MDQAFVADPDFAFRNASQRRRAAAIAFLPGALNLRVGFAVWPAPHGMRPAISFELPI
jgi:hypothetical protein